MAKISIKLASKGNTSFDLSSNHITTSDFGQLQVSSFLPVVPNDKFHVSVFSEARCAPMVVPTFMDASLIHRSFYVPMSAIYMPFENFYRDTNDVSCLKQLPDVYNSELALFFALAGYGLSRQIGTSGQTPDFTISINGNSTNHVFTEKGRVFYKLLLSLGYSVNFSQVDTTPMSLLPLLAFARVVYDYVYPSQYLDGLSLTQYFKVTDSTQLGNLFGHGTSIYNFLTKVADLLTLPFKQDYFTASWKNPTAPGNAVNATYFVDAHGSTTPNTVQGAQTISALSATTVKLLQRMYDFVTRNNIVGSRYADQIFARFGIGSRKSDPDMSAFIGQHIQKLNIVDVTAMSSAQGQDLGDLAGKMYTQNSGKLFDFESTDEFGYIITLTFVMPNIGYYQGRKRWVTQFGRFDFYTPEFDMLMRAIRNDELFADAKSFNDYANSLGHGGDPSYTFGFAPQYSEYKKGDDYLTGDFRCPSLARDLDSYHLFRDLPIPSADHPLALNADFLFCQQHAFDKIFAQQFTLRAPFALQPNDTYLGSSILLADGKPLCLRPVAGISPANDLWGVVIVDSSNNMRVEFWGQTDLDVLFGIDMTNSNSYTLSTSTNWDDTSSSVPAEWSLYGLTFNIYNIQTGTLVSKASPASGAYRYTLSLNGVRYYSYEKFLNNYRDYIDHIYLRHRFDIKVSRSMLPISEEFCIEDGGNKVNVDMNGNQIV